MAARGSERMIPALAIDAMRDAVAAMPDDRLQPARRAALQRLSSRGLPVTQHEDWKYTDLSSVIDISNQWLAAGAAALESTAGSAAIDAVLSQYDAHWLVIVNGRVDRDSVAALHADNVQVAWLSESDLSMTHNAALAGDLPLADLNLALLHDGLRIAVDGVVDKPIGILLIDNAASSIFVSQARVEIELAPDSSASVLEYHLSTGPASHYANTVIDLHVQERASANYVRLQERDLTHSQTGRLAVELAPDSRFNHCAFDLGGALIRNDLDISLSGVGAEAHCYGLYLGGSGQHIDNHTRIDHVVGPACSGQHYRGILAGAARCIWNGKAIVHAGADGTDAQQANHNLLLSERAEIDAKPELEIYADDVKCSHGTTIGQLDENAVFYLRTRGLDQATARHLLTLAFAQSIVNLLPITAMQKTVSERVAGRLAQLIEESRR